MNGPHFFACIEIDNLIESEQQPKETLRSTKSIPQDDAAVISPQKYDFMRFFVYC